MNDEGPQFEKLRLDVPFASRLIAEQFPQRAGLSVVPTVPGGWDNKTFRLGEELSVRLPSAEVYVQQVEKEHRWLPKLALQKIEPSGGPLPGPHNFYRGGPLTVYDSETRDANSALDGKIDGSRAAKVWEESFGAAWRGPAVWVHGDVSRANPLVNEVCLAP
jgi:aminoglycoside phosphotransferase (APT) family kinase protein